MTASSPWLPDELWSGAFFDGQWQAAGQRQPVIEPATGQTLGEVGLADAAQVATSAAAAAHAQQAWAAAPYEERDSYATASGKAVMRLVADQLRPRDIATRKAFENAAIVVAATGGSTNAALHLPAMANEVGIDFDLFDVAEIF